MKIRHLFPLTLSFITLGGRVALVGLACAALDRACFGQEQKPAKTFIDYFLPTPIVDSLSTDVWGAVDNPKEKQLGNDNHGSKIVVIPFDGAALDRDLRNDLAASPTAPSK